MKVLLIILGIIAFFVIILHFSVTVILSFDNKEGLKYHVKYFGFTLYPRKRKPKKGKKKKKSRKKQAAKKSEPAPIDSNEILSDKELYEELTLLDLEDDDSYDNDDFEQTEQAVSESVKDRPPAKSEKKAQKNGKLKEKTDNKTQKPLKKEEEKTEKENSEKKIEETPQNPPEDEAEESGEKPSRGGLGGLIDKYNYYKPLIPMGWKYFKKLLKAIRLYDTEISMVTAKSDAYDSAMFYGKLQMAVNNALALVCGIFSVRVRAVDIKCAFNEERFDYGVKSRVKLRPSTVIAIVVCVGVNYLIFRIKNKMKAKKAGENEQVRKPA